MITRRKVVRASIAAAIAMPFAAVVLAGTAHAAPANPQVPMLGSTGQSADGRPGFGYAGGTLYIGWPGTDSAHSLNIADVNSTGGLFSQNVISDDVLASTGVGMTTQSLNGSPQIFVAWANPNSPHTIEIGHYLGTKSLGCLTAVNESTGTSPFLVSTGFDGSGTMYLLWTGTDSAHHLNIAQVNVSACTSNSGQVKLSNIVELSDTADAGPAAAFMNGKLWIYWPGTDSGHHIWAGSFTGGSTLANHTETAFASTNSVWATFFPSAVKGTQTIWLTYKGTNGEAFFAETNTTSGVSFIGNQTDGDSTTFGVSSGYNASGILWDGFADPSLSLNVNSIFS